MRRPASQAGAGLVEVLVALALVAGGLALLFGTGGDGALRQRRANDVQAALLVAESRLAAGVAGPLAAGRVDGREGPLVYSVTTAPYGVAQGSAAGRLWLVTVSVGRPGGTPLASLRSLRLGPP
ncbi:hypothetical protein [Zavarzinia sp.]|uniref:type IV pilus modification PilV family protein n=1 Tax=Zavarzinia sp. TaxID=2027920 RepID=UPI0035671183